MKFTKMHGCGNDYIYIDGSKEKVSDKPALSRKLSDRRFGVGSDGIIFINPSDKADFEMEMYNSDGSEAQMCGNGIRCVAKYVYDKGLTNKETLKIDTKAGIKTLELHTQGGRVKTVTVDMGKPIFTPSKVPALMDGERLIGVPLQVSEKEYSVTVLSMGNPHCVTFVDDTKAVDIERIGPLIENHEKFPERINAEFIHVVDRTHIDMRVWERGSGETFACGTGACASAVAAYVNGLTDRKIAVKLIGGILDIEYTEDDGRVYMTGPAETVFEGEIEDV